MAAKPLVLKKQKVGSSSRAKTFLVAAEVYVTDLPLHLDNTFTYGIPEDLIGNAKTGTRVKVPFKQSEKFGYIRKLVQKEVIARPILEIKKDFGIPENHMMFLTSIAERYGTSLDSILKFVKASALSDSESSSRRFKPRFEFASELSFESLARQIDESQGMSLVIAPTERELSHLKHQLGTFSLDQKKIIFGLRSAIMQVFNNLENIFIFDDWSEHYRERKNPYWHIREVAILRSRIEPIKLRFISALPSMEIFQYSRKKIIDTPKRGYRRQRTKIAFLPSSYFETVKMGLSRGRVLVSVATKDVIQAVICKKCRCSLKCECGGNLKLVTANKLSCSICSRLNLNWRCLVCASHEFVELRSGAKKLREQFQKIFPNVPIFLSTAEKPVVTVPKGSIVVATPGMEPKENYAAVIFLEAEFRVNSPYLRAEEETRLQIYSLIASLENQGSFYIDLEINHPLVQSLLKEKPILDIERELRERELLHLPPVWNFVRISNGNLRQLAKSLKQLLSDAKFQLIDDDKALIVRTKEGDTTTLMKELFLVQKYLSLKQQTLLKIEREPADL